MVLVVATDGVVRGLVVARCQFAQFSSPSFCLQSLRVKNWASPFVVGSIVSPRRAIAVEVTDEITFFGQFRAMRPCHVVDPLLPVFTGGNRSEPYAAPTDVIR